MPRPAIDCGARKGSKTRAFLNFFHSAIFFFIFVYCKMINSALFNAKDIDPSALVGNPFESVCLQLANLQKQGRPRWTAQEIKLKRFFHGCKCETPSRGLGRLPDPVAPTAENLTSRKSRSPARRSRSSSPMTANAEEGRGAGSAFGEREDDGHGVA